MIFKVRLAEQIIEICSLCPHIYSYMKKYRVEQEDTAQPAVIIRTTDEDILRERDRNQAEQRNIFYGEAYYENLAIYRKIANQLIAFDTLLIHGTVVAKDGYGYMFAAPSGVGKTTRAKLWMDEYPDSFVVNGDKPLIKIFASEVRAYGTPWCGKEGWNRNTSVPLRAVFFIERAEKENAITELSLAEAFPKLLRQTNFPEDSAFMAKTVQLLQSLEGKVRFFHFISTPTPEAIRLAYKTAGSDI